MSSYNADKEERFNCCTIMNNLLLYSVFLCKEWFMKSKGMIIASAVVAAIAIMVGCTHNMPRSGSAHMRSRSMCGYHMCKNHNYKSNYDV